LLQFSDDGPSLSCRCHRIALACAAGEDRKKEEKVRRVPDVEIIRRWLGAQGPRIVVTALVAAVVTDGVRIGLTLRGPARVEPASAHAVSRPTQTGPHDLDAVLSAHLFGRSDAPPVEAAAAQTLKLIGTIATESDGGYAIIAEANGQSHLYRAGSPVVAGAMLDAVYPDHVVLLRDGVAQTLQLPRFAIAIAAAARRRPPAVASVTAKPSEAAPSFTPPLLPASGAVIRSLHLHPAMRDGQPVGMRVTGTAAESRPLSLLGLSAGDLVVDVNGESVAGQPGGGVGNLMRTINAGQTATLAIERGGRLIQVQIDPARANAVADLFHSDAPQ
jgi:type II secretory pathway component PulC